MKQLILTQTQAELVRGLLKAELVKNSKKYKKPTEIKTAALRSHQCSELIGVLDKTKFTLPTQLQLINGGGESA